MLHLYVTMDHLVIANSVYRDGHVLRREDGYVLRREDGYVLRREDGHVLRRVLEFVLTDQRKKVRPIRIWMQVKEESMKVGWCRKDVLC